MFLAVRAQTIDSLRGMYHFTPAGRPDTIYKTSIVNEDGDLYSLYDTSVRQMKNFHVTVLDISFRSTDSFTANAFVTIPVTNDGATKRPLMVFHHWGEGDKQEYLGEAIRYSRNGFICLLVNAPWNCPGTPYRSFSRQGFHLYHKSVIATMQGIRLLTESLPVDTGNVFFTGHSFGAGVGAILAGLRTTPIRAFVLMGGVRSITKALDTSSREDILQWKKEEPEGFYRWLRWMRPLDAELYIVHKAAPVFMQFATNDEFISQKDNLAYAAIVPEPVRTRYYPTRHGFGKKALEDREAWIMSLLVK